MNTTPAREDFFTVIHKALRGGLLAAALEAGRLDWRDAVQVATYQRDWDRVVELVRSHARHEDDHIWPLLESKRPGAVAELGIAHEPVEADIELVDAEFRNAREKADPAAGLTFYRALTRFIAHALDHFAAEEPAVMEMMWATCSDAELVACRSAFMAEISPEERGATLELMLQGCSSEELLELLRGLRAGMPPHAFDEWMGSLERRLPVSSYRRLAGLLAEPVG